MQQFIPDTFKPDLVIYHNVVANFACPDGLAAAWVCFKRYTSFDYSPTFLGCTYDQGEPDLTNYNSVLVVDFSFSVDTLNAWRHQGKTVYVLDHHKAFKEKLESVGKLKSYSLSENLFKSNKVLVNLEESGATLAWKVLFPGVEMPEFLKYVRDRDLFIKELPYSDSVHAGMGKLGRSFNLYDNLAELDRESLIDLLKPIGDPSLDKKYKAIAKYMERVTFWQDIPVVTLNKSDIQLKSDIGEFICKTYPFAKFCVILGKGLEEVRLRSSLYTWNTDLVSLFADMNPGGHKNACNFAYFADDSQTLEALKVLVLEHAERLEKVEDIEESLEELAIAA
jgi:uncharacterized protein